jgi:hypothetical protein
VTPDADLFVGELLRTDSRLSRDELHQRLQHWVGAHADVTAAADELFERFAVARQPRNGADLRPAAALDAATTLVDVLLERLPEREVVQTIGTWIDRVSVAGNLPARDAHTIANRFAWGTRGREAHIGTMVGAHTAAAQFVVAMELERARFLFKYQRIRDIVDGLDDSWNDSPLVRSFRMFADINLAQNPDEMERGIRQLWRETANSELAAPIGDILMHAVWLCYRLTRQGEVLEQFTADALSGRTPGAVTHFRRAAALRRLGAWDDAIAELDTALAQLTTASEFTRTFSEQIIREREFIVQARSVGDDIARHESAIGSMERDSLARSVQIVTLFTAVIAFASGSIGVAQSGTTLRHQLVIAMALGTGLAMFSLLVIGALRWMTTSAWPVRKRDPWLVALIIVLVLFALGLVVTITAPGSNRLDGTPPTSHASSGMTSL